MLFISWFLNLGFVFYNIFGENCVQKYEFDFVLNYSICFYTCSIFRKMLSNEVLMLRILMLYLKYTWSKINNNFNILIFFPNEYNIAFKIFIFIDKLENRKFFCQNWKLYHEVLRLLENEIIFVLEFFEMMIQ